MQYFLEEEKQQKRRRDKKGVIQPSTIAAITKILLVYVCLFGRCDKYEGG